MRRTFISLFISFALLLYCANDSFARTYNLRFTASTFEQHPSVSNGLIPWFKEVEKATDGQIRIRFFGPNTICPVNEITQSIVSGAIDMGTSNHNANTGLFPLHDVFFLPMIAQTSVVEGLVGWEMYRKYASLQKEMEKMKIVSYWGGGVLHVFTSKKPVRTLEDLKGLRLIGLNKGFADIIRALGAEPIVVPFSDVYMAMSRNQADGALWSYIATPSAKMEEFTRYVTEVGLSSDLRFIAINQKLWDGMDPALQEKFNAASDPVQLNIRISKAIEDGDIVGRQALEKAGCTFYELPQEERQRWIQAIAPLHEAWISDVVKRGVCTEEEARALLKDTLDTAQAIYEKQAD